MFQVDFHDNVTNSYLLKVTNKSQLDRHFNVSVLNSNVSLSADENILIKAGEIASVPVHLTMTPDEIKERVSEVSLQVSVSDMPDVKAVTETKFFSN